VIDYVICSKELFPKVKAFGVEPRIPKCDHAALILPLEIDSSLIGAPTVRSRKRKRQDVVLPDETKLDRLLIQTVKAGKDESKETLQLFGPVYFDTNPVLAGICGVCKKIKGNTQPPVELQYFSATTQISIEPFAYGELVRNYGQKW
jgi:exonuclease III